MADESLTEQFERIKLSARARKLVTDIESFEACAEAVRHKVVRSRPDEAWVKAKGLDPTYTLTGWRWGLHFQQKGSGPKTALEVTAALLVLKYVSWEECGFGKEDLSDRRTLNGYLAQFGWAGPFLSERRRGATEDEKRQARLSILRERKSKLAAQAEALDADIRKLEASAS